MIAYELIEYLESLEVTQGALTGDTFTVLPWQEDFIRGAFAPEVAQSGLTVARGNGKTTLVAGLSLASIDGPLMHERGETIGVAASFQQGKLLFEHVLAFGRERLSKKKRFRVLNSNAHAMIENRETGAKFKIIASDPKKAHGLAPQLILADEPAQWQGGGDAMVSALTTSRGKIPNSRMIALGTRPSGEHHWFARWLHSKAEHAYMQEHAAEDLDKWQEEAQWHQANPSLHLMPDLYQAIEREAIDAETDPGLLAAFQALRLNGGVSDVANRDMLTTPDVWKRTLENAIPDRSDQAPVWGIDLGGAAAMSAIASCWTNGRLETLCMFGKEPAPDVRAKRDGVGDLYERAIGYGELMVSGKRIPDIKALIEEGLERFGKPAAIVCDKWRVDELRDEIESDPDIMSIPLVVRRQGFQDGSEAVRAWKKAIVQQNIFPVKPSGLLTWGLAEAVTVTDPAGNQKLAKNTEGGRRMRARDDVVAAALLAVEFGLAGAKRSSIRGSSSYGGTF